MNIRHLQIFQAVCQTGNITKAAELLHMTQPAVSQAIRDLEAESGLVLFDRIGRRIHLTEVGRAYWEKAEPLLAMCDAFEASIDGIRTSAPLRVGSCLTIAKCWLPGILSAFQAEHENPVYTTIAGAQTILSILQENQIDLALYEGPLPPAPLQSEVFSTYKLNPVCAQDHPFAGQKVSVEEFLSQPLLLRETGSAVRDVLDSFLRLKGLKANPMITSTDSHSLLQNYRAGIGVGIIPDQLLSMSPTPTGLASFEVDGMQLQNDNRVIYHRDKSISQPMRDFLDIVMRINKPRPEQGTFKV